MRKEKIIISLILILAVILRLVNLNQSFWLDEAAQVIESSRPLSQQLDIVSDFHPPLFHLTLHFWMYLGKSEIWVRLPSVILSLASIFLLSQIALLLTGRKTAILSALFLTVSPFHLWYSQEARPYMLFVFLALLSTYFLIKKNWSGYIISTICSLYTLYFAPFLILGQSAYVYLSEKKNFKNFLISFFICFSAFSLWFPKFWQQLKTGTSGFFAGWTDIVSQSTFKAISLTFAKFIFGRGSIENNILYFLIVFPVFLIFIYSCRKLWQKRKDRNILFLFFVPVITSSVVSFFVPILAPQRLLFMLPFFILIMVEGISATKKKSAYFAVAVFLVTSIGGILQYYSDPNVQREKWREAASYVESDKDKNSLALFIFPAPFAPYIWYSQGLIEAKGIAPNFNLRENDLLNLNNLTANKSKIYLFQYLTGVTDPDDKARDYLYDLGWRQRDIKNFEGVGFIYIYERET